MKELRIARHARTTSSAKMLEQLREKLSRLVFSATSAGPTALRRRRPTSRLATVEQLEARIALDGTPIISEFMASNHNTLADEDGNYSDWLELYNPTSTAVDLGGWYLTDTASDLTEWQFPATQLDPGHFLVVFASGKDRAVVGSELHTNFKLSADGEFLALVKPDGTTIASQFTPSFPAQYSDVSYGVTFTPASQTTVTVSASADTWIRQAAPSTDENGTPISVWNTDGTGNKRYGVLEWDISGITQPIVGAHIELYNNSGQSVTQKGYLIPNGISGLTWNTYQSTKSSSEVALSTLGSGSFGSGGIGSFNSTASASAADLSLLNNLRTTTGKVTVVLKPTSGRRDWGDIDSVHQPARLVLDLGTPATLIGDLRYFSTPTPGDANQGGALGILQPPTSSVPHGYYSQSFDTVLSSTVAGATIVYTTNGSDPTLTNGTKILAANGSTPPQGTVHIGGTSTLRAAVFATNYITSNTDTFTYLFLNDVVAQSPQGQAPAGWPSSSINGQVFNYGMDPDIVGSTSILGDFNNDKQVTTDDYTILASHFGQAVTPNTQGDVDGNGTVDFTDFVKFRLLYNDYKTGAVTYVGASNAAAVKNALSAIPTISLVTQLSNLFDPSTGIYVNAKQGGENWERPVSVELLNPDGTPGFQIDAGLRIRGGFSSSGNNPKHSFRLFFDSNEGALNYPLFGDDGADIFEKIDLRTDQNDSWSFVGSTQGTLVNDVFSRDLQFAMGDPSTRSNYYQLYINGVYWGVYQTQERPSKEYGETYFGGDASDYDVIKVSSSDGTYATEATDGNLDAWHDLWLGTQGNMADNANYFKLQGLNPDGTRNLNYPVLLDVDNLIDYMLVIFLTDDEDAPLTEAFNYNKPNNFYAIRNRNGDQGFQFFAFDAETTLFSFYNHGGLNGDRTGPYHGSNEHNYTYSNPQWMHQALMANAEYRLEFADRMQKAFYDNGPMTAVPLINTFLARANVVGPAMLGESARWGDAFSSRVNNPITVNDWQSAVNADVYGYLPFRTPIVINQLKADGLYPTTAAPTYNIHGGTVTSGTSITLSAAAGNIYYTLDGSDPRLIGGSLSPSALLYSGPISITHALTINARAFSSGVWSAVNTAGFSLPIPDLRVSELMYHAFKPSSGSYQAEDFDYIEFTNVGTTTINLAGITISDGIDYTFPNGTLAPGQFAVVAKTPAAFAIRYPGVTAYGPYDNNLSNSGELLTIKDAGGATIQAFTYVDSWYPTTDGDGYSLVPVNLLADVSAWNSSANWRASTNFNGSPGAADPSPPSGTSTAASTASEAPIENPVETVTQTTTTSVDAPASAPTDTSAPVTAVVQSGAIGSAQSSTSTASTSTSEATPPAAPVQTTNSTSTTTIEESAAAISPAQDDAVAGAVTETPIELPLETPTASAADSAIAVPVTPAEPAVSTTAPSLPLVTTPAPAIAVTASVAAAPTDEVSPTSSEAGAATLTAQAAPSPASSSFVAPSFVSIAAPVVRSEDTITGGSASLLTSMALSRAAVLNATGAEGARRERAIDSIFHNPTSIFEGDAKLVERPTDRHDRQESAEGFATTIRHLAEIIVQRSGRGGK